MGYGLALLNGIELGGFGSFLGLGLLWTWIELGEFDVWLGLFSYWLRVLINHFIWVTIVLEYDIITQVELLWEQIKHNPRKYKRKFNHRQ